MFLALAATEVAAEGASVPDILAAAAGAGVVILGEVHDNPAHHVTQAEVLAGLGATAIVFEHITPAQAALVTPGIAADAAALAAALDWDNSGWPDFANYAPLFAFGAEVPVYGALVGREAARGAFDGGAAAVFAGDAGRFGLDRSLPEAEQAAREAEQMAAHCDALPPEILPGFVEAQRLRDAALAEAALAALEAHGAPVAVITGNGHARADWGVPALIALAAPEVAVFTLGQFEAVPEDPVPFDLFTVADPADRPDPCAAFR
ncbi:ChaN family lipoprotein [Roseibacterium sp. KMU-115]|uniref:ChaN family lipoprotein n=1 Tax=Roseicyclus persicicus TaxID=2650661 RepID=A0A7X6JYH9_9RHOB|nr:ChaN family lipoprotein [Roseibacterium persicicum]